MIVRWSLDELPATLAEVGIERPFLIASTRWEVLDLPHAGWWTEVPSERVEVPPEADGILAVGGGSAIDTGKYASAQSGKPVVHVPTTYSGAEWTTFYGIRSRGPDHRRPRRRGAPRRDRLRRRSDARSAGRHHGRHGAERARALCRGALRAGTLARRRRTGARGRAADRRLRCRACSQIPATAPRASISSRARRTPVTRSRSTGSRSRTRWRRRSAGRTACRTVR